MMMFLWIRTGWPPMPPLSFNTLTRFSLAGRSYPRLRERPLTGSPRYCRKFHLHLAKEIWEANRLHLLPKRYFPGVLITLSLPGSNYGILLIHASGQGAARE